MPHIILKLEKGSLQGSFAVEHHWQIKVFRYSQRTHLSSTTTTTESSRIFGIRSISFTSSSFWFGSGTFYWWLSTGIHLESRQGLTLIHSTLMVRNGIAAALMQSRKCVSDVFNSLCYRIREANTNMYWIVKIWYSRPLTFWLHHILCSTHQKWNQIICGSLD